MNYYDIIKNLESIPNFYGQYLLPGTSMTKIRKSILLLACYLAFICGTLFVSSDDWWFRVDTVLISVCEV